MGWMVTFVRQGLLDRSAAGSASDTLSHEAMPDATAQFATAKYLSVETFRKSGVGVRTPVWFAADPVVPSTFYLYSEADAGKVKRIRNNPRVRVAPCDIRGKVQGAWVDAHARICQGAEATKGQELLKSKYGLMKRIGDFFSRLRGRTHTILAIHLD